MAFDALAAGITTARGRGLANSTSSPLPSNAGEIYTVAGEAESRSLFLRARPVNYHHRRRDFLSPLSLLRVYSSRRREPENLFPLPSRNIRNIGPRYDSAYGTGAKEYCFSRTMPTFEFFFICWETLRPLFTTQIPK